MLFILRKYELLHFANVIVYNGEEAGHNRSLIYPISDFCTA